MSQSFNQPTESEPVESFSWNRAWLMALTQPSDETFRRLVRDPQATGGKGYLWILIAALIAGLIVMTCQGLFIIPSLLVPSEQSNSNTVIVGVLAIFICGLPIWAIFQIIGIAINVGISQAIASMLGGGGSFGKLSYTYATFLAPLILLTSILGVIPIVGLLNCLVGVYVLILNVFAIKAVNQFDWGKAILSSFGWIAMLFLVSCGMIAVLTLFGPAIGNVLSTIQNSF